MAELQDQSTASLDEKLRRFLAHLANPADTVHFFEDGYPRPSIHVQASVFLRLIGEGKITLAAGVRAVDPLDALRDQHAAGIGILAVAVQALRDRGNYSDEEGEATNALADLLDALDTPGVTEVDRG